MDSLWEKVLFGILAVVVAVPVVAVWIIGGWKVCEYLLRQ